MNQGAYLFKDSEDDELCLFLFMKLNKQQMDVALPNAKDEGGNGDYFIGIMRGGTDYLGKTFYGGIEEIMKEHQMFDLTTTIHADLKFDEVTEEDFEKYKTFADEKMKSLEQIKNLVG